MKNQLSDQQITSYRDDGFLAIPDFLDLAELAEWRSCTGEVVAVRLGHSIDFLTTQMNPDDFYARMFTQCLRLADTHERGGS